MEHINQTLLTFLSISSELDKAYHQAALKLGLSDSKMNILYLLSHKPYSQKQICELSGMSKQTVNSALKDLIAEGIIEPQLGVRHEQIKLTDKGDELIDSKLSLLIRAENSVIAQWSESERRQLIELNQKFLTAFLAELAKF
ncbi:MAG: MarR family transcriptional regulator [Succinivibrio sp.]|nr:MarR family transcriptional regulator [Succinivibrio sp.]